MFNRLLHGPEDWTVLHSLDLAPWNRGKRTEIDFVLVIPTVGILCIEVKSSRNIRFDEGRWQPATITRSPFKQALDASKTLHRRLKGEFPSLSHLPIVHLCIFPFSLFEMERNISVNAWELMDATAFDRLTSDLEFCNDLVSRARRSIEADPSLQSLRTSLSPAAVQGIADFCSPVKRRRPSARVEVETREIQALAQLREQQKPVLELAETNDRIIIRGPAGTGKTLIALELARRLSARDIRVGLLCFNQFVGDWIEGEVRSTPQISPRVVAGRALRVMANLTEIELPLDPPPSYWDSELPQRIEDRLTDPECAATAQFDYLILDEAQDLIARPRIWQCLGHFLRGGFADGQFALFGDFDHQVLADREEAQSTLKTLERTARPTRWKLQENCRNYKFVGDAALGLTGLPKSTYSGYRRAGGGSAAFDIGFYKTAQDQLQTVKDWINHFRSCGFRNSEIVLLSFNSDSSPVVEGLRRSNYRLRDAWRGGDEIGVASVYKFKGMESKVVILTDICLDDSDFRRDAFYVGLTRATEAVRILCSQSSMPRMFEWMREGVTP